MRDRRSPAYRFGYYFGAFLAMALVAGVVALITVTFLRFFAS